MLAVAVAADDIRTMLRHALPEEAHNVVVALLPCQLVFAGSAYGFRYLRVCVQAVERIFAAGQRVKDGPVVEFLRHTQDRKSTRLKASPEWMSYAVIAVK